MIYFFISTFLRMITEYSYTYTMWYALNHKSSPKFPNGVYHWVYWLVDGMVY